MRKYIVRVLFSRQVLLLVFLLFLAMRIVHLQADPPQDLSWSLGLFFDEGVYNHNVRNQFLFGEWKLDEWNDYYYSAISTWMKYQVLKIIGVGRAQIRLISIAYSMFSLLFVYLAAKESYGKTTGFIALLLFGTNYVSLMYARIGMQDTQTLTVFIAAFYCWQAGMRRLDNQEKLWGVYMFLAGMTVFISYTYKNLFLYLLPVPFVALFVMFLIHFGNPQKRGQLLKACGVLLFGTSSVFFIWYFAFYRPNQRIITQFGSFFTKQQMFPYTRLSHFLRVARTNPLFAYFSHTPVILIGAFLTLLFMYVVLFSEKRRCLHHSDVYVMAWFWAVFLFTSIIAYRPTRYFLPLIPPLCLLTARGLGRLSRFSTLHFPKKLSMWLVPVAGLWLAMFFGFGLFPLRFRGIYRAPAFHFVPPARFDLLGGLVVAGGSLVILWIFFTRSWWKVMPVPRLVFPFLVIVLAASSLVFDGRWYYRWFRTARYDVVRTGEDLTNYLGDDAYIGGMNALGVAYDTPYRVLFSWDKFVNFRENPFEKYHLTHLFLGDGAGSEERRYYYRMYPQNMSGATLLQQYLIKNTTYTLFSLIEPHLKILSVNLPSNVGGDLKTVVQVSNSDFRNQRKVFVNWYLYSGELTDSATPVAIGRAQERWLFPQAQQTFSISGFLPAQAGTLTLLASWHEPQVQGYQAESAESIIGTVATDADAMGNKAVVSPPMNAGFLLYGHYRYGPPGAYEISCRIKVGDNREVAPIFRLEAVADYGKTVLRTMDVSGTIFHQAGTYQNIIMPFLIKSGQSHIEFRLYSYGKTRIWIDEIQSVVRQGVWWEQPIILQHDE